LKHFSLIWKTLYIHTELEDSGLPDDVGFHEQYARGAGADRQRRRAESTPLQGQVRLPTRVHDERILT